MTQIKWNLTGTITGGPALAATDTLEASAYDRASFDVKKDGAEVTVELVPKMKDSLLLLIIKPDKLGKEVTFKVNETAAAALPLKGPQVFSGAAGLLIQNPIERLLFKNTSNEDVNVEITIGRNAIPPTPAPAPAAASAGAASGGTAASGGGGGTSAAGGGGGGTSSGGTPPTPPPAGPGSSSAGGTTGTPPPSP
jgi:hypothetical protein